MKEAIKKELAKALSETIAQARENTIFTDEGRIFLDACALDYGAAVNSEGELIDANGKVMDESSPEYKSIVALAKKQARGESAIGRDIIGS